MAELFSEELRGLEAAGLLRACAGIEPLPGGRASAGGRTYVNFGSNDYLDLASHPEVTAAAAEALRAGAGAGGSRLMTGTRRAHEELEAALAAFKRAEACAVFPSGYHVNTAALPALAGDGDLIVLDRLCHASLVDGARLSRAKWRVFRHNDPADLDRVLARYGGRRRWVVTESVFSMDGDAAPLPDLVDVAERHGAFLYVDEAHAAGVLGPEGRGLVNQWGLERRVAVVMGTLSKALGGMGGFLCGQKSTVDWIRNRCRSFIYSTALAPALASAALAALRVSMQADDRRAKVSALSAALRRSLGLPDGFSPSVPWIVGDSQAALAWSRELRDAGFWVPAVRPPTVPEGTARLRFSVTAGHAMDDVERLARAVRSIRDRT